jgi:fructokinase
MADDGTATDPDVLVAGETLVDFLPEGGGPLSDAERFVRRPGGAPANVAAALAELDATPYLLTRVGDDPFGDALVAALDRHGVPDRFVQRDPDRQTSLAFVGGDESFTFYRENTADAHLDTDAVPDNTVDSVSWLVAGGVMLAAHPGRERMFDLVERAGDCTVAFDPNARPELWGDDYEATVARAFETTDVVKVSEPDLAATRFAADDPADLAHRVVDAGPHTALVTRGDAGAVAVADDRAPWGPETAEHPGYDVDAVDPTGAGDAFLAGAVAALSGGSPLGAALAVANATAALTTTAPGAMRALPDRAAVADLVGATHFM